MQHFAFDSDAPTDIVPSCELANSEHIAVVQANISIRLAGKRRGNLHSLVVPDNFFAVLDHIAGQGGLPGVSSALETACEPNQFGSAHVFTQGVSTWTLDFAFDAD